MNSIKSNLLYVQEKIHPKHIIEDLKKQSKKRRDAKTDAPDMFNLFGDFNGLDPEARTEFYQHDQHWQNRMILGDSLQVMASLAERENLRGKVQCIYFDPPYGIKFNSNWQVSTRNREVDDGKIDHLTREPEQVRPRVRQGGRPPGPRRSRSSASFPCSGYPSHTRHSYTVKSSTTAAGPPPARN